jgi:hypothetical protein
MSWRSKFTGAACLAAMLSASTVRAVPGTVFATQVSAYVAGTVPSSDTQYTDSSTWLGVPQGTTGASAGFPGVVSAFNPPFDADQILLIGVGGHLALKFPEAVEVGTGKSVGVFSNAGLSDSSYPSAVAYSPVQTFGGGQAKVRVSEDGVHWVNLGLKSFEIPQNYYTNAGAYDVAAPSDPAPADYADPYTGGLAAFDGETNSQVLATLNGSAGGKWLSLASTGLTEINYIKFTEPADLPAGSKLAINAVSVAEGHVAPAALGVRAAVAAVPLPPAVWTGLAGLVGMAAAQWAHRRRQLA